MIPSCHRCGGDLAVGEGASSFCPHCGAPQLYLREHLLEDRPAIPSTGSTPPPNVRDVEWQPAIRAALFVAVVAPPLCLLGSVSGFFSLLSFLWIVGGAIVTIGVYRKQRPTAYLDAGIGARIGVVAGAAMAATLSVTFGISGLIARFIRHGMGSFDAELTARLHEQIDQMAAQAGPANPIPPWLIGTFLSPEFRAAIGLTSLAIFATGLVIVCALSGAFAGTISSPPRSSL